MSRAPLGRRAGAPDTRSELLEAARTIFSEKGFDGASVRAIAGEAGVDPSLIYHYFGTKEGLFAASIYLPAPALDEIKAVLSSDRSDIGRSLAMTFFTVWENEGARASLLGVLRSATAGEEHSVASFRQFLTSTISDYIAPRISGDDAHLRALLMASHLIGVAMTRHVVRLEPIASASIEEIIELVAPRIQSYVDDADE